MSWRACDRFESLSRSHSQASSRAGRPKVLRNGLSILPSGICVARLPCGRPSNAVVVPVTVEMASSNTSAGKSLVKACEKYRDPAAQELVALGTAAQPQSSLVGDLAERFGEQQAALGGHDVDAAAARIAAEGQIILVGAAP